MENDDNFDEEIIFRTHAIQRMHERSVRTADVRSVLQHGEQIEGYPDDEPYPSRLILGWVHDRPLHVVVAEDPSSGKLIVITVYEPDSEKWSDDFKERENS